MSTFNDRLRFAGAIFGAVAIVAVVLLFLLLSFAGGIAFIVGSVLACLIYLFARSHPSLFSPRIPIVAGLFQTIRTAVLAFCPLLLAGFVYFILWRFSIEYLLAGVVVLGIMLTPLVYYISKKEPQTAKKLGAGALKFVGIVSNFYLTVFFFLLLVAGLLWVLLPH